MHIGEIQIGTGVIIVRVLLFAVLFAVIFKYMGPSCESIYCKFFAFFWKGVISFFMLMGIDRLIILWYS